MLIASRPVPDRSAPGTALSLTLHGLVLTLAIVATAERMGIADPMPTRVVPLAPFSQPRPAPPAPVAPKPTQPTVEPTTAPQPTLPVVSEVPSTIPAPASEPVTSAPVISAGEPTGEPGTGEFFPAGTPLDGALGASEVDVPAALLPSSPLPRYPDALRRQRVEGVARVRFVVGTNGRVEPATVVVIESTHAAFSEAVRSALPRMRFRPARIGTKPVRQLVEFPLTFRVEAR
ncbi:MAG: TonB family protein [Gemmatimonadaceae bacterium]